MSCVIGVNACAIPADMAACTAMLRAYLSISLIPGEAKDSSFFVAPLQLARLQRLALCPSDHPPYLSSNCRQQLVSLLLLIILA